MWLRKCPPVVFFLPVLILLSIQWAPSVQATRDGPKIVSHELDNFPTGFFYFDGSNTVIILDQDARKPVLISDDAGESWEKVDDIGEGQARAVFPHPYDNRIAYVLGSREKHWITTDQGKSWTSFKTKAPPFGELLSFHASDSNKVILHTMHCPNLFDCEERDYYTTDGFKTLNLLRENTKHCVFAHSTPLFKTNGDDALDDRIICIAQGRYSPFSKDHRLVVSNNYFKNEFEPNLEGSRTVQGVIKMATVKGFLVVAAKAENTDELAMYVTKDTQHWHRAEFPSGDRVKEDAYTILESTNYSIQVDVMTTRDSNPMGVLFTSNSNGTYFTKNIEHTNRNREGTVDFEKISGIQGIVLVNVVKNFQAVENSPRVAKKLQTKISFDDGRKFKPIKYKEKELHLHSVSDMSNFGRTFSSPAPGLVMGVGNTGDFLEDYDKGDLYVSDDAGLTWSKAIEEAHKYEIGDQGAVLVAVYDEGPTNEIQYSIDHGKKWQTADFGKEEVRARILTTTPDSTSLKFILLATVGGGSKMKNYLFSINFEGLHERKCKQDDFEEWYARLDEKGKPDCIMGHKQKYRRRKADANCFVDEEFEHPDLQLEPCVCSEEDFECDYNFVRGEDSKECVPLGPLPSPKDVCKEPDGTYTGSSGFRMIPGNDCVRKGGVELDQPKERPCTDSTKPVVSGKITNTINSFRAGSFQEQYYLERAETSQGTDQTVVMRTDEDRIYLTHDHGKTWEPILEGKRITAIYPQPGFNDRVYFLTAGTKVFYSVNRGSNIRSFDVPDEPTHAKNLRALSFCADNPEWLIWTGASGCGGSSEGECHSVAHISQDRGSDWRTMLRYVRKCEFIKKEVRGETEKLVYCEQFKGEKLEGTLQLRSSDNFFKDGTKTHFDDIVDFATMDQYIIVAAKESDHLKVGVSVDGKTFADALFPPNFQVPHQRAYTVLDSSTKAVFLHVTVETRRGSEYGSIIKSNSNGTSYVLSLSAVNRNEDGYVDFEKMLGLPGVALANVVHNLDKVAKGDAKSLKSMITHNDGADWARIPAPQQDAEDHDYKCDVKNVEECSLHLHGYTERRDSRDTFSSPSAVGLMMGVGNVGKYLSSKSEGNTFITSDGGISWRTVKNGNYMWEYGDQGSIIVIVEENVATNVIYYSRDEGQSWKEHPFSESKMNIFSITTVPSDTSRNFLLWGKDASSGSKIATVNLDFTGLTDRQCVLSEENPEDPEGDYYLWSPEHPLQKTGCLFGRIAKYHRKKIESDCYNGRNIQKLHEISKECECTREDYEWYVAFSQAFSALLLSLLLPSHFFSSIFEKTFFGAKKCAPWQ